MMKLHLKGIMLSGINGYSSDYASLTFTEPLTEVCSLHMQTVICGVLKHRPAQAHVQANTAF